MSNRDLRSLSLFWLHWILANATSIGAAQALLALIATIEDQHSGAVGVVILIPLGIAILMLIGYSQQVVLQRRWQNVEYWFALMPLNFMCGVSGLALGGIFAGTIVGLHEAISPGPPSLIMNCILTGCVGLFFGAGFGILQTSALCDSWRQTATWCVASGAGFTFAMVTEAVLAEQVLANSQQFTTIGASSLLGTLGGALYGLITGGALIWLLPARSQTVTSAS